MYRNKELRKVPAAFLDPIASILDINEDWKTVMSLIPKDLQSDHFEPKYNSEHMRLIEQYAQSTKTKCARVLFDEWGTAGRVRPTLQTLWDILEKAQMFRAADTLALMLNENPPPRPTNGPAANIDTNVTSILNNTTSEQNINTRKLSDGNGATNGTYADLCNDPTKKMDPSINLMNFSNSQDLIPNFEKMGCHSTEMIKPLKDSGTSTTNLIKFSKEPSTSLSSSTYLPDFAALLPDKGIENSSVSTMSGSSASNTEISQSVSEFISNSDNSQSSHFQMPSIEGLSLYDQVDSEILENNNLTKFKYSELEAITKKFADSHIGSGGFGDVFVGDHEKYGLLAIKRAHNMQINSASIDLVKIFNTEVKSLSILRHMNIVPILGYSLDGPAPCIVCKYIEGGSLLENIKLKRLNENQRMNIMKGTADGLKYIHSTEKPSSLLSVPQTSSRKAYFLHGDVKSANILITKDCIPMLCDFGLSKQCATTFHTESIMGTSAYMAPERFSGTITQKGDIFSFGIVLLELLTGLEPIVQTENHEHLNIKTYVKEKCVDDDISSVLDPLIENRPKAQKVYDLARLCIKNNKNKRPTMEVICDTLHKINESSQHRIFIANV